MKTSREFAKWLLNYVQTDGAPGERLTTAFCARCGKNGVAGFVWRHETFGLLFETVTRQSRRHQWAEMTGTRSDDQAHAGVPGWRSNRMVVPLDDVGTITTTCKKGHVVSVEADDLARNAEARRHATKTLVVEADD